MKAAAYFGVRDVRCIDVDKPVLENGDILLKIKACGICGSDLHTYKLGLFPELGVPAGDGRIMGHEFSGEVVEIAGQAGTIKTGDRVVTVGMGANAEYCRIPAMLLPIVMKLPDNVTYEEAATTEPLATSLHAVNLAPPTDNSIIVIMGAGIIGLGILQILKATSSAKVIVTDFSEKRLALASELGADIIVNAGKDDIYQRMLEETGSVSLSYMPFDYSNVDTVFDCAGMGHSFSGEAPLWQALKMVKENGKIIMVAVYEKPPEIEYNIIVRKNIYLIGSWAWSPEEFGESLQLIASGKVNRKPLITHEFPLEQASEAYETQCRTDEAVKVLIKP